MSEGRVALILGATGATGSKLLEELVARDGWSKVITVGRRAPELRHDKVSPVIVEDIIKEEAEIDPNYFKGVDHFFNCIGTTRAKAGGAKGFHAIEVGISEKVAKAASTAGVENASVISAQGAHNSFGPSWFHPLYYGKCMYMKEQTIKEKSFERVTIFRPGALDRMQSEKGPSFLLRLLNPLPVDMLARAMANDAEATEESRTIAGNGRIRKLAEEA